MDSARMTHGIRWAVGLGMFTPASAMAYIGPGAGLGAIAITLALIAGIVLLGVGLVWYPLKRLMKKGKKKTPAGSGSVDSSE